MKYIYDRILEPKEAVIQRYETEYELDRQVVLNNIHISRFVPLDGMGGENIAVYPVFAEQYLECKEMGESIKLPKFKSCIFHARRLFGEKNYEVDSYEDAKEKTDILRVHYKDIEVVFEHTPNGLRAENRFKVFQSDLFENNDIIDMTPEVLAEAYGEKYVERIYYHGKKREQND